MKLKYDELIFAKITELEEGIHDLKTIVEIKKTVKPKIVSLKGMGKLLVSEVDLEKAIEQAKKSLSKGIDNEICG
ncbi:MAG: hypothetical protein AABY79_05100 [Nitrospirota bacterium]